MNRKLLPRSRDCESFLRQFIMYLENNYSLYESWQICNEIFKDKRRFQFIPRTAHLIEQGHSWKTSMQKILSIHSILYHLSWPRNHEGLLNTARHIILHCKRRINFLQLLISELIYPFFVISGVLGTVIVFQLFVRPRFFQFLAENTTWQNLVPAFLACILFLLILIIILATFLFPIASVSFFNKQGSWFQGNSIINLRTWEVILIHLDIHMMSGFTLWDAILFVRQHYALGQADAQLVAIQHSLFESKDLKTTVLRNTMIPQCLRTILYSSLQCNKFREGLPLMLNVIVAEIDEKIRRITSIFGPVAILLSGWAVLALSLDLILPIHRFLGEALF